MSPKWKGPPLALEFAPLRNLHRHGPNRLFAEVNKNVILPMIILEQGDMSKTYPGIDLKILILKILNQKVVNREPIRQ